MSLYEVSDIVRDQSFLARDLLRGGEAVRISEKSGTRNLKQWDRLAARIVKVGPKYEMAGGVLGFAHEPSDIIRDGFVKLKKEMRSEARKRVPVHHCLVGRCSQAGAQSQLAQDAERRRRRNRIHDGSLSF